MIADKKRELMKKHIMIKLNIIIAFVFAAMMIVSFSGCKKNKTEDSGIKVVTVSYVQYDFARAVCGENADIAMLSKPGGDVHGFEPSLADIRKIAKADVFVYTGGESDGWVEKILESIDNLSVRCVKLCDSVELLCSDEKHEGHNHEHGGHHHFDEHIQSSPKNAVLMVEAICNAVSEADYVHKNEFEANAAKYIAEIEKLDAELTILAGKAENKKLIVADRFPFLYLARHYGFEYEALFAGCSQENDANPSVMMHMADEVKSSGIDTVFCTELSNGKMADVICSETGAVKRVLHSCEGISKEDFENGISYVQLMQQNISNLREAIL